MKIYGLQKTSLLDYPEHLSAILFTGGCNFSCPYCQNSELLHPHDAVPMDNEEIFSFLKKRSGILEGVVITGGEPSLADDLPEFIHRIRNLGLKIKLDTNGTHPDQISILLEQHLLDYIAMDVKASPEHYCLAAGISSAPMEKIRRSIDLVMNSGLPYEFRTTVVKELHDLSHFHQLGQLISGARLCCLQTFRDGDTVNIRGLHPFSENDMKKAAEILQLYVHEVKIR
ncbi:MAG: anaerobic ribonucleoside-triphosphate reductase activating protein [Lachnospiraceae bacterium]